MALACGHNFSLFLTAEGHVYACGVNTRGQLGSGDNAPHVAPVLVHRGFWTMDGERGIMVSAGAEHGACVTEEGSVFTWGNGGSGQLGTRNTQDISYPEGVYFSRFAGCHAVMVACGELHTLVLSLDGRIYSGGSNMHGQLGVDEATSPLGMIEINRAHFGAQVSMIAAGGSHSLAAGDGALWTWGYNSSGQLGIRTHAPVDSIRVPAQVPAADFCGRAVEFVAGGLAHSMIVTSDGLLWGCGCSVFGQLGLPLAQVLALGGGVTHASRTDAFLAVPLSAGCGARGARMVSCGPDHSLVVAHNNTVWSCGDSSSGALGTHPGPQPPQWLLAQVDPANFGDSADIQCAAAGRNHSAVVTATGHVYTCGRANTAVVSGLGYAADGNQWLPRRIPTADFGGELVGRWNLMRPSRILALAMGWHARLGAEAAGLGQLPPEMLEELAHMARFSCRRGTAQGVRHLLGFS